MQTNIKQPINKDAAPELYEALQYLLDCYQKDETLGAYGDRLVYDALTKAQSNPNTNINQPNL